MNTALATYVAEAGIEDLIESKGPTLRDLRNQTLVPGRGGEMKTISREQLALIVGVSPMTIYKWEKGEMKPSYGIRPLYAQALNVTGRELENAIFESAIQHSKSQPPVEKSTRCVDPHRGPYRLTLVKTNSKPDDTNGYRYPDGAVVSIAGRHALDDYERIYRPMGFDITEITEATDGTTIY